jgi:hypothetical protein
MLKKEFWVDDDNGKIKIIWKESPIESDNNLDDSFTIQD